MIFNEADEALSFLLESQPISFEDSRLVWEALWQVVDGTDDALVRARVMNTAALFLRLDLARMTGISSPEHVGALAEVCCSFVAMSYSKLEELSGEEESCHEDAAAEWLHATVACVQYVVGAGIHLYECKLIPFLFFGFFTTIMYLIFMIRLYIASGSEHAITISTQYRTHAFLHTHMHPSCNCTYVF